MVIISGMSQKKQQIAAALLDRCRRHVDLLVVKKKEALKQLVARSDEERVKNIQKKFIGPDV